MESFETSTDQKPLSNHRAYLEVFQRMRLEQRIANAFELSEITRSHFRQGLRERFPDLPAEQYRVLYLEWLKLCHNRNY